MEGATRVPTEENERPKARRWKERGKKKYAKPGLLVLLFRKHDVYYSRTVFFGIMVALPLAFCT